MSQAPLQATELFQAFCWTCDACGRDNFVRGVTIPPASINLDDLPDTFDREAFEAWVEAGGSGDFVMSPSHVICGFCKAEFKATDDSQAD